MSTPPSRRPGPESTLDDVKQQLIDAAIELLRSRGVDIALADVALSDAIAAAGVTRSTAYRSLADETLAPQAVLHRELLNYLLTRFTRGETIAAINREIEAELERQGDRIASDSVADRTVAVRAVLRVAANRSYTDIVDSSERAILTSLYGAIRSSGVTDWRFDALQEGEREVTVLFTDLYSRMTERFGFRIRPPFTIDQFTAAGASLVEGMAMRHGINVEVSPITRPTGPAGADEEWTLFAAAFEAMFIGFFEPVTPEDPFADLARY